MAAEEEAATLAAEEAQRKKEEEEAAADKKNKKNKEVQEADAVEEVEEEIELKVIDGTKRERTMLTMKRPLKNMSSVLRQQIVNLPPAKFVDAPQTLVFDARGMLYDRVLNWDVIQMPVIEKMCKMLQNPDCVEKKYSLLEKIQNLDEVCRIAPRAGVFLHSCVILSTLHNIFHLKATCSPRTFSSSLQAIFASGCCQASRSHHTTPLHFILNLSGAPPHRLPFLVCLRSRRSKSKRRALSLIWTRSGRHGLRLLAIRV